MAPLQPLQQTVFEQGPQAATVPTGEPIPVYQEGQVILPEPINPAVALDPGVNWYGLGEQAMKVAQGMVTETWDYLIRTKANSVAEIGDKYQTKLNELYQKQTTELYNARTQKRLTNEELMEALKTGINEAKSGFKKEATEALGGDAFFEENIRMGDWGQKYQELAVLTRRTMRDLDTQASKLLYDSQRVVNGVDKKEANHLAWLRGGVGMRPGKNDLQAQYLNGTKPIPTTKNGFPILGFETDIRGAPIKPRTVQIEEQEVPLVYKQEDGNWYLNPIAMSSASWEDLKTIYDLETSGSDGSTGIMSMFTGQPTAEMQERIETTLKGLNSNPGERAFIATMFASMPDSLYENVLSNLTLDNTDRSVADILKMSARAGVPIEDLATVQGLRTPDFSDTVGVVRALASSQEIPTQQFGPQQNQELLMASTLVGHLVNFYGFETDVEDFTLGQENKFFTDTTGLTAHKVLQENPGLKAPLLYVLTLAKKRGVDVSNPEEANNLLQTALSTYGQVAVPNPMTGIPNFVYAPSLVWSNRLRRDIPTMTGVDVTREETWPEEIKQKIKEDPKEVNRLLAQSYWYSTNWMRPTVENQDPRDYMIRVAKQMNRYVDVELLEAMLDAGVILEKTENGSNTQGALPFGHFVRMVVAASPSVIESIQLENIGNLSYRDPNKLPTIEQRLMAANMILADLDPLDGSGSSELGFSTDIPDLNFMAMPKGGMALQFKALAGKSGKDYLKLLTTDVSGGGFSKTSGGPYTVRNTDSTPVFFIPAEQMDPNRSQTAEYAKHKVNLQRYVSSLNGTYRPEYVSADSASIPAAGSPNPESLIPLVTAPSMRPKMDSLVEADMPLTSVDDFVTFQVVNNDAIWNMVDEDPVLKALKSMKYEVATKPGGIRLYDPNKTLFSEENLELLFEQAIKSGAKTNKDMLGFMFKAMELYKENPASRFGRETRLEQDTNSSPQDFLGVSGKNAGVVLFTPQTDAFYDGVSSYLNQGYNLYQQGDKFYMFKPENVPSNSKLTLRIDSSSPEKNTSIFAPYERRRTNAKLARQILFAPKTAPKVTVPEATMVAPEPAAPAQKEVKTFEINNQKWGVEPASENTSDTATLRFDNQFNTVLGSKQQERAFRIWKEKYAPEDSGLDYDLRGAFVTGFVPDATGHWPDTFKKPSHPTYSDEAIYAQLGYGKPGKWFAAPENKEYPEGAVIDENTGQYFIKGGKPETVSPGAVGTRSYMPLITEFEDLKTEAYYDETGKIWTIGKGTTKYPDGRPVKKGDKITTEEAEMMAENHVQEKVIPRLEKSIPTWNKMNPNQQAAIISFAYNVGENFYGRKGFETITKALSSVDNFGDVPKALALYKKSGGKTLAGLVRRRAAEAKLFNTP